jgi:NADPH:quinone reductase-like Zn-dependent oxidoreductase
VQTHHATHHAQIAKALGARVTATCGPSNVALVTQTLGADVAVDYTKDRFDDVAPGPYDIIVDLIGGDYETRGVKLLKKGGKVGSFEAVARVHGLSSLHKDVAQCRRQFDMCR